MPSGNIPKLSYPFHRLLVNPRRYRGRLTIGSIPFFSERLERWLVPVLKHQLLFKGAPNFTELNSRSFMPLGTLSKTQRRLQAAEPNGSDT
jgi:hypothetical protein